MVLVFETERLAARLLTLGDAERLLAIWNDPLFVDFVADRGIRSVADAESALEAGALAAYASVGHHSFGLERRSDGAWLGSAGLIQRADGTVDVGYALVPEARGHGYAREAAAGVLAHAWRTYRYERIYGLVNPRNVRSIAVLVAVGLTFESVRDENTHVYVIARPA